MGKTERKEFQFAKQVREAQDDSTSLMAPFVVARHSWNKALELEGSKAGECVGCPFLDKKRS